MAIGAIGAIGRGARALFGFTETVGTGAAVVAGLSSVGGGVPLVAAGAYHGGKALAKAGTRSLMTPSHWTAWASIAGMGLVAGKTAYGGIKGLGGFDAYTMPRQGLGIVGTGMGYNATFKKPGGPMPHNNIGATGDLTLAAHTNRHGIMR